MADAWAKQATADREHPCDQRSPGLQQSHARQGLWHQRAATPCTPTLSPMLPSLPQVTEAGKARLCGMVLFHWPWLPLPLIPPRRPELDFSDFPQTRCFLLWSLLLFQHPGLGRWKESPISLCCLSRVSVDMGSGPVAVLLTMCVCLLTDQCFFPPLSVSLQDTTGWWL